MTGLPRRSGRQRQPRGFTLLEALVALVLTAAVATLSMQIMTHLARIEQALADRTGGGADQLLREVWLRESLSAATPLPAARGNAFRADALALEFPSFSRPGPVDGQPSALVLRWRNDDDGRSLLLQPAAPDAASAEPARLWQGGPKARWHFASEAGVWRDTWPPPLPFGAAVSIEPSDTDQLPQLVWLEAGPGSNASRSLLVRLWTSPRPLPSRRQVEAL